MTDNPDLNHAKPRFDLLDGARGIAAIAVMLYHFTNRTELKWLMGAWVAVDLFFILSGFVIALSYGSKLRDGMCFLAFAKIRLLRLAPLYMAGLLLGYAGVLLAAHSAATAPEWTATATATPNQATIALIMAAVWLPWPNAIAWPFDGHSIVGAFYPLNDPAWSLAFELIANAAFFFWVARRKTLSSASLVALSMGIFIAGSLITRQFNPGFGQVNFMLGFPRVIGEFFLGALVFQLGLHRRRYALWLVIVVTAACVLLMVPEKRSFAIANSWLLIPLVVPLLASVQVGGTARRLCHALGELSYPLYVLHVPVCRLVYELAPMPGLGEAARVLVTACVTLAVASMFAHLDMQLRVRLSAASRARRAVAPVHSQPPDSGMARLA